jgi:tetratricopeptide (TPR) repeat protein
MPDTPDSDRSTPFWKRVPLEYVVAAGLVLVMLAAFLWSQRPLPTGQVRAERPAQEHLLRARVLVKHERFEAALGEFQNALQKEPDLFDARLEQADLYYDLGRMDEALSSYEAALEVEESPEPHMGLGLVHLGKDQPLYASRHFREALRLDPGSLDANQNLGIALVRAGETEEAALHFRRAVEIDPTNLDALHNLGYAMRVLDQPERGIELLEIVVERDPKRAISLYELGVAYAAAGRNDDAIATFEKLLEVLPSHDAGRQRLEELKQAKGD